MVKKIKRFFEKRKIAKRLKITRQHFQQIEKRTLSENTKAKLKHKYLKKIHWLQRELAQLELN